MSESGTESTESTEGTDGTDGIADDQLPEDLQPTDDNPLAQPLAEDEALDDLDLEGGKAPEESGDDDGDDDGDEDEDGEQ